MDAPLSLISGTFRLSNAASNINAIRANGTSAANAIGANKRIWVAAGTLNVLSQWRLNAGELRITGGTVNVGTTGTHYLDYLNNSPIILQGGALTIAGPLWGNASSSTGVMEISGGTMTVGNAGNAYSAEMMEVTPNCTFTMSGGTIVIARSTSFAENYVNLSSNATVTGGALQIGRSYSCQPYLSNQLYHAGLQPDR
ncbi:MAG: hypothetical protein IPH04_10755 [Saprospirales bacterium]|nr:hypothetical protein [Saprospirales bacterium]